MEIQLSPLVAEQDISRETLVEKYAKDGENPVEEVRRRVTSPGGLTERGTAVLENAGLRDAFDSAVDVVVNP